MRSLGCFVLSLLSHRPWRDVQSLILQGTPIETFSNAPEFKAYFDYTRSLRFDENPNYTYLRGLVKKAFNREGFMCDYYFDWVEQMPQPSPEQLRSEFRQIYNQLQNNNTRVSATSQSWSEDFTLHYAFLDKFHDLLLIANTSESQRPFLSDFVFKKRLQEQIFNFMEVLKSNLPASRDHMLFFIELAYSTMMTFLEEFPRMEGEWLQCLSSISLYRSTSLYGLFVEEDRKLWDAVTHSWHLKSSQFWTQTGEISYYLAITAPNSLQTLFYCSKSLYAKVPPPPMQKQQIKQIISAPGSNPDPLDTALVKAHAALFSGKGENDFRLLSQEFLRLLAIHIERATHHIAVINITAMLGYGSKESFLTCVEENLIADQSSSKMFERAQLLNNSTLETVLEKGNDFVFSFVYLVLMYGKSHQSHVMHQLVRAFPWQSLSRVLNSPPLGISSIEFSHLQKEIKGLDWAEKYFQNLEQLGNSGAGQLHWMGRYLAAQGYGLSYDAAGHKFSARPVQ
jgi:hypothetical protein